MLFELRIKFKGDEGDEVAVIDLADAIAELITHYSDVEVLPMELRIPMEHNHVCQGRKHAASN